MLEFEHSAAKNVALGNARHDHCGLQHILKEAEFTSIMWDKSLWVVSGVGVGLDPTYDLKMGF